MDISERRPTTNTHTQVSDCKALLDSVLSDVIIAIRLLVVYQPDTVDATEPAQKRARVDQ